MEEIRFRWDDGSEYIIRTDNSGDSVYGEKAHEAMHAMNRFFTFKNVHWQMRVNFINKREDL